MDKFFKIIDFYIKKINNTVFENQNKLNFLNEINIEYKVLYKESFTDLLKLYYVCFSNQNFLTTNIIFAQLEEYLNRITFSDVLILDKLYNELSNSIKNNEIDNYLIKSEKYEDMVEEFNNIDLDKDIKLFFKKLFINQNIINFDAYNTFIKLLNTNNKLSFLKSIITLFDIGFYYRDNSKYENKVYFNIEKEYPGLINTLDSMNNIKLKLLDKKKRFDNDKNKKIEFLNSVKDNIKLNKVIDIKLVNKYIKDDYFIACINHYNNFFIFNDYGNKLREYFKLEENSISEKERILKDYDFYVDYNKISISDEELESKLILINESLIDIKKYNNIVLNLLNIELIDLKRLINIINLNEIDHLFICDNIDKLSNEILLKYFICNIELLSNSKLNIKNIIKYDSNILFKDTNKLNKLLNIYKKYNINYSDDVFNYEFLNKDYSYIIDKYIEIGEYDLIKDNPSLINDNSNMIIKRCIFNKSINEVIKNDFNKLLGVLRKESSYYISDNRLNECVVENYNYLIPSDILDILNSDVIKNSDIDLSILDRYKVNDYYYLLGNMYISVNKGKNNLSKFEKINNELLFYSIIYNYPNIITLEDVIILKEILNIKTKTLKIN